ncbi:BrxA family protein [Microcella frigidaquae]|uniref:BrxA family protein n=1 Tax=Microcella frigidaquae TaxID=424758 RepID=UPI00129D2EE1|nr:DUF1819 family protein [Microcella frigidaquae]
MNLAPDPQRYQLSFTAGALYLAGAPIAAELYLRLRNWAEVRGVLRADNLLRARTAATTTRWSRELVQRLETLSLEEVELLADATSEELAQLMWTATCRRYALIAEFAEEVLRDRFLLMQTELAHEHFDAFVSGKSLWHDELSELEPATFRKLRSNLFTMLREGNLISEGGTIIPTVLSVRVKEHLVRRTPSDVRFFPTREIA